MYFNDPTLYLQNFTSEKKPSIKFGQTAGIPVYMDFKGDVTYCDSDTIYINTQAGLRLRSSSIYPHFLLFYPGDGWQVVLGSSIETAFRGRCSFRGNKKLEGEEVGYFRGSIDSSIIPELGNEVVPLNLRIFGNGNLRGFSDVQSRLISCIYYLEAGLNLRKNLIGKIGVYFIDTYGDFWGGGRFTLDSIELKLRVEESEWNLDSLSLEVVPREQPPLARASSYGVLRGKNWGLGVGLDFEMGDKELFLDFFWRDRLKIKYEYRGSAFYPFYEGNLKLDSLFFDSLRVDTSGKVMKGRGRIYMDFGQAEKEEMERGERVIGKCLGFGLGYRSSYFDIRGFYMESKRGDLRLRRGHLNISFYLPIKSFNFSIGAFLRMENLREEEENPTILIAGEYIKFSGSKWIPFFDRYGLKLSLLDLPRRVETHSEEGKREFNRKGLLFLPSISLEATVSL